MLCGKRCFQIWNLQLFIFNFPASYISYSNFDWRFIIITQRNYTSADNSQLLQLANKCPYLEGEVIYEARAMYNIINSAVELFKDNCPDKNGSSSSRMGNASVNAATWIANIYPVPASNELFISWPSSIPSGFLFLKLHQPFKSYSRHFFVLRTFWSVNRSHITLAPPGNIKQAASLFIKQLVTGNTGVHGIGRSVDMLCINGFHRGEQSV